MGAQSLSNLWLLAVGPLLGAAQFEIVPRELQGQPVPQTPLWLDPNKQLGVANCVVDIGVATVQLGQAGLGINAAVKRCDYGDEKTAKKKRSCAATALGIAAVFQYAAFFMSSAAIDCGKTFTMVDKQAMNSVQCAADTQLLLASLTLIASAGTAVSDECEKDHINTERTALTGKYRSAQVAECVFDVGQIMLMIARAGLFINAAVKDCSAMSLYQGPGENKLKCSADIGNMIGAFAFTAGGIAASVEHCPQVYKNNKPGCAGAILALVGATAKVQAAATSMAMDCTPAALHAARRLGSNFTSGEKNVEFI